MATYAEVLERMPREAVFHTITMVSADKVEAGWKVTMGVSPEIGDKYFLTDKPHRLVLFLLDGEEFEKALGDLG